MKNNNKPKQEWKLFFFLLKQAKLPWHWYVLSLILSLLSSTISTRLPQTAGKIVSGEIFDSRTVVTYIVVTLVMAIMNLLLSIFAAWINLQSDKNLRKLVWKKIIHLPLSETDKIPPTSLVSRVTVDTSSISGGISNIITIIIGAYSLGTILMIVNGMSHKMLWMLLLVIPFVIIASIPSHFMSDSKNQIQNALSRYTNFLSERLSSLKQIKAFTAEEREDALNAEVTKDFFKANIKLAKLDMIAQPFIYSIEAVVQAIILIYGGYLLSTGELDSASAVSLFMYSTTIALYTYQFVFCWQAIKKAQGAATEASCIVKLESEEMQRSHSFTVPEDSIRMENISFAYEDGEKVLDDLTVEIPVGKVTAIVGPSGSGKSTVLKLLERLYQPNSGKIVLGEQSAEDIHLNEWRNNFGMVPQDSPLLVGTVRDNIMYGIEEELSEEALQNVIEKANVSEILEHLPEGLQSSVGDVGEKLSGGEKQRIALARMMIRNPEFLLLDEATSNLDAKNEYQIIETIFKEMQGKTSVIVTHNLHTIENADNIVFLENGKMQGRGTHAELYANNDKYHNFVDLQKV